MARPEAQRLNEKTQNRPRGGARVDFRGGARSASNSRRISPPPAPGCEVMAWRIGQPVRGRYRHIGGGNFPNFSFEWITPFCRIFRFHPCRTGDFLWISLSRPTTWIQPSGTSDIFSHSLCNGLTRRAYSLCTQLTLSAFGFTRCSLNLRFVHWTHFTLTGFTVSRLLNLLHRSFCAGFILWTFFW